MKNAYLIIHRKMRETIANLLYKFLALVTSFYLKFSEKYKSYIL